MARGAQETLRPLKRGGLETAREHAARGRRDGIVGAGKPRDRIQEDDDVLAHLHLALRLLQDHLGHLHVPVRRLVEGRGDDLALDRALHVRHLFRPLVDQEHHDHHARVVLGYGVGDLLENHGLAGLGGRDDKPSLALADRGDKVQKPGGRLLADGFQGEAFVRMEGGQIIEERPVLDLLGVHSVDFLDLKQGEKALPVLGRAHRARDHVPLAQPEALDLGRRDINVVRPGKIAVFRGAQESEAVGVDFQHPLVVDHSVGPELAVENPGDHLLLAQARHSIELEFLGDSAKLGHRHLGEPGHVELAHRGRRRRRRCRGTFRGLSGLLGLGRAFHIRLLVIH